MLWISWKIQHFTYKCVRGIAWAWNPRHLFIPFIDMIKSLAVSIWMCFIWTCLHLFPGAHNCPGCHSHDKSALFKLPANNCTAHFDEYTAEWPMSDGGEPTERGPCSRNDVRSFLPFKRNGSFWSLHLCLQPQTLIYQQKMLCQRWML